MNLRARTAWAVVAWAVLAAAASLSAVAGDDEDRPLSDTPEGRRAFEDVRAAYESRSQSALGVEWAALALGGHDAAERARAAAYLVALFRQTKDDEARGRTPRGEGMLLWGGPQDRGAALRWTAARRLSSVIVPEGSTEALAPALWLWREEQDPTARTTAMELLRQVRHPDADAAVAEALRDDRAEGRVLVVALREVARRRLPGLDEAVSDLQRHYLPPVREAAAQAAAALGIPRLDPAAAPPEGPFVASLEHRLRRVRAWAIAAPPPDAVWVRYRRTAGAGSALWPDQTPWTFGQEELAGWRLPDEDGHPRILDWFGQATTVPSPEWRAVDDTIEDAARRLVAWRAAFDAGAPGDRDDDDRRAIRERMGIEEAVTPRAWEGTLPEGLVAAWLYARGDRRTAAELLEPVLSSWSSEAAWFDHLRDDAAARHDETMLRAFAVGRYEEALSIARLLAAPAFDGWEAKDRARDLVREIPRRSDDFKALALPAPDAWTEQVRAGPRADLVSFLAARLRLIHDLQMDIPGGVSYTAPQYDHPAVRWKTMTPPRERERVNPLLELLRLDLTGAEALGLVPWLASEDHILAFDRMRFMPNRPQTLHRVRWVVAEALDSIAGADLVDRAAVAGADPWRRVAEQARLAAWFAARGAQRASDRWATTALGGPWGEAQRALRRLIAFAPPLAAATAARRAETDAEHRGDCAIVVGHLGGPAQVAQARAWLADPDAKVRFFGAWVLLRHGDRAAREGVDAILAHLRSGPGWEWRDAVVDDLWATGDAEARRYLEAAATPGTPDGSRGSIFLLQRRVLAGDAAALDRVIEALDGRELPILGETPCGSWWKGRPIDQVEGVLRVVNQWRPDPPFLPWGDAAAGERTRILVEVRAWLREQRERLRAGQPLEIQRTEAPELWGPWGFSSSGWVRRL